ncbi:uncharacterized protein LOC128726753 [Anopheles nili]|uniref:uncharacterized protein LOC128726753 n=1 Tax=Anopheles nili TaxID=185578 RepID=UPI00237A5F4A|nr:uncharacterized protein LOC128726753 [Anopheles nili]
MPKSSCSASFCKNNRYNVKKRKLDVLFHTFPFDSVLNYKWIQFCRQHKNWRPAKDDVICSAHFKTDDYQLMRSPLEKNNYYFRRLFSSAIPSIECSKPLTISEKKLRDEELRKQLSEQLYSKDSDELTINDHTYSEAKSDAEPMYKLVGSNTSIYRLKNFPDVCAHCLKPVNDENLFTSVYQYHDKLECTIEQKCDKLTGDLMGQKDRDNIHNHLPDKVCAECLESLITFHQYQRQLECIRKFCIAIAKLLNGNQEALDDLYRKQGVYLVNRLKRLEIYHGSEENASLGKLIEQVALHRQPSTCIKSEEKSLCLGKYANENMLAMDNSDENFKCEKNDICWNTERETSVLHSDAMYKEKKKIIAKRKVEKKCTKLPNQNIKSDDENIKNGLACPYEDICTAIFYHEADKQKHVKHDHTSFECHTCGNVLAFYSLYQKHMESHAIARALLLSYNKRKNMANTSGYNQNENVDEEHLRETMVLDPKQRRITKHK